ncbi:MAG: exodeoxyribonuclease VII large subunit [Candidatus Omnitrophica bacterium]|nr:exodeoxyribonuclease VII large subunit [Candidatus Omnitrophota bacterium]
MSDNIFTVSELNGYIKDVINAGFPQIVWICGEIQGFDRNKNKNHIFFELVEKDEKSKDVKARVGVVLWEFKKAQINQILRKSENAFELKDDIEVKLACKVDYYVPHGAVRLVVESIDPVYTLGKLAQEKQKLIALLKAKGVLDKNKQLALPTVPLNIGLITSDDSAAYNDFMSELKKSGFSFNVYLRNTLMQGKKAEADTVQALKELQQIKTLDVIVITRGGGSISDLSCFDSQIITEAVANANIPILSGIGHEINITITDLAAHTFAKTPTAIAQFIVGRVQEFVDKLNDSLDLVLRGSETLLERNKKKLINDAVSIQTKMREFFKEHHTLIARLGEAMKQKSLKLLASEKQRVSRFTDNLTRETKNCFRKENDKVNNIEKVVRALHPENILKRGFSITRDQAGKAVKSIKQVKEGDTLTTQVVDGNIENKVVKII